MRLRGTIAAAVAAATILFGVPAPAAARVAVSVELAFGGMVVGGVGFFVYLAGSWGFSRGTRDVPTALVEVCGNRARLGVPLPLPGYDFERDVVRFDLVRWRF